LARLDELKQLMELERKRMESEEENIRNIFKMKADKMNKETQVDENIRAIQFLFEEWFSVVGQFMKKPKAKPKT
jgi:hypothetical protein